MADRSGQTAMAREIAEIPALADGLLAQSDAIAAIAERIESGQSALRRAVRRAAAPAMWACSALSARGAAWPARLRRRAVGGDGLSAAAAKCATRCSSWYRSPAAAPTSSWRRKSARECGALTLAIVNDENSPAAKAADLVLPIGAGPEKAVAATKTVALSMIAGAQLVAALSRDDGAGGGAAAPAGPAGRAR